MTDPFLAMHRISELRYSISGNLSPIGIRDQMVRARLFVDRAIEQKLIGPTRQLFVVGAGIAGVTAAFYAAKQKQIHVTLIDKREQPFHLQRECQTRCIDPTLYDWPAAHWSASNYPWPLLEPLDPGETIPIAWGAMMANLLAGHLTKSHNEALTESATSGYYRFLPGMKYIDKDSPVAGNAITVKYRKVDPSEFDPDLPSSKYQELESQLNQEALNGKRACLIEEFGAVLDARGFRPERLQILPQLVAGTSVNEKDYFRSIAFWRSDTFADTNLGLPPSPGKLRVIICGDGDGALQDFLRIATGKSSAKKLMEQIEPLIPRSSDLLRQLYSAEDQGYRAKIWNSRMHDHNVHLRLDLVHKGRISNLLASKPGKKIKGVVAEALKFSEHVDLRLAHPCCHFTAAYPLNRFLVHLVSAVVESLPARSRPSISIIPHTSVQSVECIGHKPGKPEDCLGKEHLVKTENWPDCRGDVLKGSVGEASGTYDAVILRLGLEDSDPTRLVHQLSRHLMPYHPQC
jgi:putative NAD(P)-binding protein